MNILLTGPNGFLGKYIYSYFKLKPYAKVATLGRSETFDYNIDLQSAFDDFDLKYDIVIHAAGKAHTTPKNLSESDSFFKVNYTGTLNLLKALSGNPPTTFIFISTVSVYGLNEAINVKEGFSLQANDPYGKSKILAEQSVIDWATKHQVKYLILRLPLLVGNDAPGNLGAMIKAIKGGYYFNISGGKAKRSMLLVEDVPRAIEHLLGNSGIFNLTDGYDPSYAEISNLIGKQLGKKIHSLPFFLCKLFALIGDVIPLIPINSIKLKKLNHSLTFDSSTLRDKHGFIAKDVLQNFKIINI